MCLEGGDTMSKIKMIDIEKAVQSAISYCEENGLSVKKLKEETSLSYCESLFILGFPVISEKEKFDEIKGRGFPILIVNPDYSVIETECTRDYLSSISE